jgi:hypothetical protein
MRWSGLIRARDRLVAFTKARRFGHGIRERYRRPDRRGVNAFVVATTCPALVADASCVAEALGALRPWVTVQTDRQSDGRARAYARRDPVNKCPSRAAKSSARGLARRRKDSPKGLT